MATQHAPEELVERVQGLLDSLDEISDPVAQGRVQELMGAVLELHGAGLDRMVNILLDAGDGAAGIRQAMLDDGVVASLLLIHGLYPIPLEERVQEALDSVRPFLASHGGDVELLGVDEGVARLRLKGSCNGCPASAATLEHALKEAIEEAAPDLLSLEVEGAVGLKDSSEGPAASGLSLPMVQVGAPEPSGATPAPQYTECPSGVGQ
ncbi:MAG: NifU family protein [Actinomycetota bacterium]|nr:NifU family protein [Actinomycetota bacterium]